MLSFIIDRHTHTHTYKNTTKKKQLTYVDRVGKRDDDDNVVVVRRIV